jgi:carboxyl-terminal processing protease
MNQAKHPKDNTPHAAKRLACKNTLTWVAACCFALSLSLSPAHAHGTQAPLTTQSTPLAKKNQAPLPDQDVENFVRSLAVIKHFYIKETQDDTLFNNAIRGMVGKLDPHSTFLDHEALKSLKVATSGRFSGIGVEVIAKPSGLKVVAPLDGSPAKKAGIQAGDLIIQVDGTLLNDSNINRAVKLIRGEKGSYVTLTVLRDQHKKPLSIKVMRDAIRMSVVRSKMLAPHYGYVRIAIFQGSVKKQLNEAIAKIKKEAGQHLDGLVLDLRNNPGGLLEASVTVTDTFLSKQDIKRHKGLVVYTKGRHEGSTMELKAQPENQLPNVPMVVLINQGSASAAEIVAGALQDYHRAIIMGERSFGKGSVQTVIPISTTAAIKLTTALYYTPAGRSIQARGIEPDVRIPNFAIKSEKASLLSIQEKSLNKHLEHSQGNDAQTQMQQQALHKKNIKLAQSDYPLYRALMMLRGMHAVQP